MCDELGNDKYMQGYITEYGSTSLCVAATKESCDDKELDFIDKWSKNTGEEIASQIARLRGMAAKSMKPDLKAWLGQRLNVLTQLKAAAEPAKEEL